MVVKPAYMAGKLKKGIYRPVHQPKELIQERSSFQRQRSVEVHVSEYNIFFTNKKLPF